MATIKLTVQDLLLHLLQIPCQGLPCGPPSPCGPASKCPHNTCNHGTHIRTSCDPGSTPDCGDSCGADELALDALRKVMRTTVTLRTASPRKKTPTKKRGGKKR